MTPSRDDRGGPGKKPDKPLNAKPEPTGRQAIEKALQEKAEAEKKSGKTKPGQGASRQGRLDSPAAKPFPATSAGDRDGRHRAPDRGPKHRLEDDDKKRPRPATGSSSGLMTDGDKPTFGNSAVPPVPKTTPATGTSVPEADSFAGEVDTPAGKATAGKKPAPSPTSYGPGETKKGSTPPAAKATGSDTPKPKPGVFDTKTVVPDAPKATDSETPKPKPGAFETKTVVPDAPKATDSETPKPKPGAFETKTVVPDAPNAEAKPKATGTKVTTPAAKPKTADTKPKAAEAKPKTADTKPKAAEPKPKDTAAPKAAAAPAKPAKQSPADAVKAANKGNTGPVNPPAPTTPAPKAADVDHVSKDIDPAKAEALADLPLRAPTADTGSNKQIKITEKAMNKVIEAAVRAVPGTISRSEGIDKLTGRNYPRYEVKLDDDGDAIAIDAFIAVGWPAPVAKIAEKARETIITWVGDMTDVPVVHANVTVGYVEPGHDRITAAEIEAFDPHPKLTPVTVTTNRPNVPIITDDWEITPHTVTGEVAGNIRSIPVPEPLKLKKFSAGNEPEIIKPVTKPAEELRPIVNTWKLDLAPIEVRDCGELTPITVADEQPLTPVTVAEPTPEVPVTVAEQQPLSPVTVAESTPLASIETRDFGELTPIETRDFGELSPINTRDFGELSRIKTRQAAALSPIAAKPNQVRSISAPKPAPLTKVYEPKPHRLADVTAPNPVRLAEVRVAKTPKLATPEAPKLRLARIVSPDDHKVARPKAPVPQRLAKVEVASRPVKPVALPKDRQVSKDLLPEPTPLKEITVSPANVRSIKVVDQ